MFEGFLIVQMKNEPTMTVGILDRQREVTGRLNGDFVGEGFGPVSGRFSAKTESGMIVLTNEQCHEIARSPFIRLTGLIKQHIFSPHEGREGEGGVPARAGRGLMPGEGATQAPLTAGKDSTFTLFNVIIGISFHWERREDQTFQGNLILAEREDGTITAINEILLEDYLQSVISSEMSPAAPLEFLRTHAILSRSWLLKALERKRRFTGRGTFSRCAPLDVGCEGVYVPAQSDIPANVNERISHAHTEEIVRWYEQEDHDLFDVCADDHCQRYQGITKILSDKAAEAVWKTRGQVITYDNEICDARYSKACGGLTEAFETAWDDTRIPYLTSISDAAILHRPVATEEAVTRWILSEPEVYCNTKDAAILDKILPDFDRETKAFFRWTIAYFREELEEILREKSGLDFGTLKEIEPLSRGASGRIYRLKITGSIRSVIVGKELEIRRWLSKTHLYSSAFIVKAEYGAHGEIERFIFYGAGWGHGVGLCQIGAAVMATREFSADKILRHYFPGTEIRKVY
ncbi:MAG: amidase [Syntrophus sp. (in: bacteria)]|nr:amidase [Syntrophus sp. (in: bacteria)]